MDEFTFVCRRIEVPAGTARVFNVGGNEIALFNVDGNFYAIDSTCPHRGGSLGEGEFDGEIVTCPLHGWRFNVKTGISPMNMARVRSYKVKIDGEKIYIEKK